jgi:hypothetical protein
LLIGLDDRPPLVEDVYLKRHKTYGPTGQDGERTSTQLDDARLYEQLRSARTLTIRLSDSDLDPVVFDLIRLFGTPLQAELDECMPSTAQGRTNYERVSVAPSR